MRTARLTATSQVVSVSGDTCLLHLMSPKHCRYTVSQ